MRKVACIAMMAIALYACGSGSGEQENAATVQQQDSARVVEDMRTNMSYLNDFNALEAVFGNENWMKIEGKDTSYLYFSRLGNFDFNVYAYRIEKGDSSKVVMGKMKMENNQLTWEYEGKKLLVTAATVARIAARTAGSDTSATYEFTRLDQNSIGVTYPGQKKIVWKKTLPFSLFLVRSRYDYANGTRYAFDTTDFQKRRRK